MGIPVTSVHRTLIDLGDVVADDVVEDALDRALDLRLTSVDWLTKQIAALGTQGRKGPALLKKIIEQGQERASWLERRFIRRLNDSAVPAYFREFQVTDYYVDFAWPEVLFAVEVHGAKWHRRRKRWAKDLARHNDLTTIGWTVLYFTWGDIKDRPDEVIREINAVYGRLARRLDLDAR